MPRAPRTSTTEEYGISSSVNNHIQVTASRVIAETDATRLARELSQHRLILRNGRGDANYIYHDELSEVIAVLMRYRANLPNEVTTVPGEVSEVAEDIFTE